MNINKRERKLLEQENARFPRHLVRIEPPSHIRRPAMLLEAWRSRDFLVQVYRVRPGLLRLSVNRTAHTGHDWQDRITWDDLQRLKGECGRGELDAVEVYPREADLVNVANMRHLFVFEHELLDFAWRAQEKVAEEA